MTQSLTNDILDVSNFISETLYDSGSGTYALDSDAKLLLVEMSAGGGGGGASVVSTSSGWSAAGQGGQSGAACSFLVSLSDSDRTAINWSVGRGGVGEHSILASSGTDSWSDSPQDVGINSTFGDMITCQGGKYGQPAGFFTSHDRAGGAAAQTDHNSNGIEIGTNDCNDSDINRASGVTVLPYQDGHIILNIRSDLGFAAGGRGKEDTIYPGQGRPAGAIRAYYGTILDIEDGNINAGGGGGSTFFGRGGDGAPAAASDSSCAGRPSIMGYGGGGGGAGCAYVATIPYYGNGGAGKGGFIRIRAYK